VLEDSGEGHGDFFLGARQALKIVRRRRESGGRWSLQIVCAITNLDHRQADPALLATWIRGLGSIEAAGTGCGTWPSGRTTARTAPTTARPTSPPYAPWRSTPSA
jgi:hypothetical protein